MTTAPPRGAAPDLLVRAWIDDRLEIIVNPALVGELERVLLRPTFADRVGARAAAEFVERVRRHATLVEDPPGDRPSPEIPTTTISSPSRAKPAST